MNKCSATLLLTAFLTLFTVLSCNRVETGPPNFIILQLDDLGYDDMGIHGNSIVETPNIDFFGSSSMQFEQFYVNPVCAPSRASLLTGRHFLKTGVSHVHGGKDFISLDETLLPESLKTAGYATGMWGKWHSGHTEGYFPWQRGFDEAYMAQLYKHRNSSGVLNGVKVEHNKWADQVITDYAIDFISRNRDLPFFAYLSFLSIHAPLDTPDSLRIKYLNKGMSNSLATLYGMVEHSDFYIGKLFYALDTMGLNENTIVFFMSDNGPAVLNDALSDEDRKIRYVNGMKGHKGNIWENGVRSPLFVKWKGVTSALKYEELVDVTDIYPTILKLARIDSSVNTKAIDGLLFDNILRGEKSTFRNKLSFNYANRGWPPTTQPWTPEGVMDEYKPVDGEMKSREYFDDQIISLRKGKYKLMHKPGDVAGGAAQIGDYVLIDILADPQEEKNLYEKMPEEAGEMKAMLKTWWQSVLNEPASFSMPVFFIAKNGERFSYIPAKAPLRTGENVKSCYAWLTNFFAAGDFAEYSIDVASAGLYRVSILYKGKPNHAKVRVSVGKRGVENSIELYDRAMLGSFDFPEGKQVLRFEIIDNPSGTNVFERLEGIELEKR